MNKTVYGIAMALVLGTTAAFAGGNNNTGGDSCRGNCPQEGGSGGSVDVSQGQHQESFNANQNTNSNQATSGAIAGSSSDSTSTGVGIGGGASVGVAVETGPTVSGSISNAEGGAGGAGGKSYSTSIAAGGAGGDSYSGAYSEGSNAGASVGDVTSSSGPSTALANNGGNSTGDVTVEDNSSVMYRNEYDYKVNTAASLFTQVCQNGMSGQGSDFGFSIVNSDAFCDNLQLADVMREAFHWEMQYGTVQCADDMSHTWVDNQYEDHCVSERAIRYYEKMHYHLEEAMDLVESTEEVALVDRFTSFMARPIAIIGALIWLL